MVFVLAVVAQAADLSQVAHPFIRELKTRADAATGGEKSEALPGIRPPPTRGRQHSFNQGDLEKGQAEIREVVDYAHKAADAASASGKHLKETEIDLRKLADVP